MPRHRLMHQVFLRAMPAVLLPTLLCLAAEGRAQVPPLLVSPALKKGLKELPSVADRPKVVAPAVLVKTIFARLEFAPKSFCDVNLHLVFVPGKDLGKFTIPARFFGNGSEVNNDKGEKPLFTIPLADITAIDPQGHVCRVRVGDATFQIIVHEKKTISRK